MNEQQADVLAEIDELIAALTAHSDPAVGEKLTTLLERIDAVHRAALTHLMGAIQGMAGEAFVNRLTADPAIRLLFMSYDLVAVDRRMLTEEALDTVRGHLHAHGVDVELLDVVGSVVYVKLHVTNDGVDLAGVARDIEAALQTGLIGFQQLEIGDRAASTSSPALVPISGLRRANKPVYRDVLSLDELAPGTMRGIDVDGEPILLANVDGTCYAIHDGCGESPLPLRFGVLDGAEVRCSWHGCRYDVRSGARVEDGVAERVRVFPVSVEDGTIRVAIGVQPAGA